MKEQQIKEQRDEWSCGRRWYDNNRQSFIIAYGVFMIIGFAMGGIVGFFVGRCTL
jgi:hypothetical protein